MVSMDELKLDLERRLREQCFALGNTERLSILSEIQKKPRTVTDILKDVKITQSTLSHHLRILRKAGFVTGIRSGRHVFYSIRKQTLDELSENLKEYNDKFPVSAMILVDDDPE